MKRHFSFSSIGDIFNIEMDELLIVTRDTGFGVRKQEALKSLVVLKSYNLFQVPIKLRSRRSSAMVTRV